MFITSSSNFEPLAWLEPDMKFVVVITTKVEATCRNIDQGDLRKWAILIR